MKYAAAGPVVSLLAVLVSAASILAQEPAGPPDIVVLQEVLPALSEHFDAMLPEPASRPRNVLVNPTVVRHQSKGSRLDSLPPNLGRPPAVLPLNARLAPRDCNTVQSIFDCGLDVGDAIVHIGNGRARGEIWLVQVHVAGPLNSRGDLGGGGLVAEFQLREGRWELTDLSGSGVF